MGNQHGTTEVSGSGSEARYGSELFLAETLPCVPGLREQEVRVRLLFSPLQGPLRKQDTPALLPFFFFFLIKSQLKFGYFSPTASPAKTFSGLRPLHVDLPSLSQQPLREPPPQHVTNCYVSFLGLPFLWHQRLNKSAPFRVNVGQQPGRRGKLIEVCSAMWERGCVYLK